MLETLTPRSIQWKIGAAIFLTALLFTATQSIFFSWYNNTSFKHYTKNRLFLLADIIGSNSAPAILFGNRQDALEVLASLSADKSIDAAFLFSADRTLLAEYRASGIQVVPPLSWSSQESYTLSDEAIVLTDPVINNDQQIGTIYVRANTSELEALNKARLKLLAVISMVLLLVALAIAISFQRILVAPIKRVTAAVRKITSEKNYSVRIEADSNDETGALIEDFNTMIAEIERRDKELLQHMTLLKRTNAELDQFVYVASHDLKAPLRGVDNLANLIAKETREILPADKLEYLDLMQNRIRRMEALFDDLLQYSRVGRIQPTAEEVDTRNLVEDTIELLSPPPGFTFTVEGDLPTLTTSRAPLEQVFRNLIGNAIKHNPSAKGKISISGRNMSDYIEFEVSDDGPGIAKQYHTKVFQMFQTLKPRDEVEGSGFGLALVKKIVERQGGGIELDSDEGRGAKFKFTWNKQTS